ncbi:hypothetical protein ACFXAQ_08100, partial [Streptomyces olivaceus]
LGCRGGRAWCRTGAAAPPPPRGGGVVGLPGTADVWDSRYTVTAYGMLMDRSCARAPHPTKTKEVLA